MNEISPITSLVPYQKSPQGSGKTPSCHCPSRPAPPIEIEEYGEDDEKANGEGQEGIELSNACKIDHYCPGQCDEKREEEILLQVLSRCLPPCNQGAEPSKRKQCQSDRGIHLVEERGTHRNFHTPNGFGNDGKYRPPKGGEGNAHQKEVVIEKAALP